MLLPTGPTESRMVLQWYGDAIAKRYIVEAGVGGVWGVVATIIATGRQVYEFISPLLEDGGTYHYRVSAEDSLGNRSSPRYYEKRIVCTPPAPSILAEYGASMVTLTAV